MVIRMVIHMVFNLFNREDIVADLAAVDRTLAQAILAQAQAVLAQAVQAPAQAVQAPAQAVQAPAQAVQAPAQAVQALPQAVLQGIWSETRFAKWDIWILQTFLSKSKSPL